MATSWAASLLVGALVGSLLAGLPDALPAVPATSTLTVAADASADSAVADGAAGADPRPPGAAGIEGRRVAPVPGSPLRRFAAPEHTYGPGHRGVDLPAEEGATVVAPTSGTVTFAGPVAGREVLVLRHNDGLLTSLEPVSAGVPRGARVTAGQPVGTLLQPTTEPAHCRVACLHWGVRRDDVYLDPWAWLAHAGPVRLLPVMRARRRQRLSQWAPPPRPAAAGPSAPTAGLSRSAVPVAVGLVTVRRRALGVGPD